MASTGPREAREILGTKKSAPMFGGVKINKGCAVLIGTDGYARPGALVAGMACAGNSCDNDIGVYDNTAGASGDMFVEYWEGVFGYVNSGAGVDLIADADRGKPCYIVDDNTVAKTSAGGTRSPSGRIERVEDGVVYVKQSIDISKSLEGNVQIVTIPVVLSKHSNGSIAARFTPGYAGRIKKISSFVTDPVLTAAKLATFTAAIATVATTGGALALTSANATPVGAKVDGSALTAGMDFGATDEITIAASAVTAFVEGQVTIVLTLEK